MESWEIEARLGIQVTMSAYQRFVDTGNAEGIASLFTEECTYQLSRDLVCTDRDSIVAGVESTKSAFLSAPPEFGRIRHHVSSINIDVTGPATAKASSYFLAVANYGPDHWGMYRDELELVGDRWFFRSRQAIMQGALPHSPVAHLLDD